MDNLVDLDAVVICNPTIWTLEKFEIRAEIHQDLLSQFSLLVEFLIGKVPVKDWDSRYLTLVNLAPGLLEHFGPD